MKKLLLLCALLAAFVAGAAPQKERLGRGAVAVQPSASRVVLSWRSFGADDPAMTFDVYRNGEKANAAPISNCTYYNLTDASIDDDYEIRAVLRGETVETFAPIKSADPYLRLRLDRPAGGKTPDGVSYTYTPNDCSVGDVDGDGEYEIFVKWDPSNQADNSQKWYTGNVFIDCYRLDGTRLWRIDLGVNIRAGAHYTQFMVYDLDGDGRAEMACKTAPGTVDGLGHNVIMGSDDPKKDYRNSSGIIVSGPEYLTVFDGLTGAERATTSYVPLRSVHAQSSSGWGDNYGNRSERYLACVAYLDGQRPSLVMCRGYYTHAYLCAWDFDGTSLTQRWLHASTTKGQGAYGEGCHSLTVGDVDADGCDEIIYGSAAIDHDGSLLHRTGGGHGDALHLGDFDPDHEGLEVFMVHEEKGSGYKYDASFRDAATGKMLWSCPQSGNDIGRGMAADISAAHPGHELWASNWYNSAKEKLQATFDCHGNQISEKRLSTCFRLYWDGDPQDELFDGSYDSNTGKASPHIDKPNEACTSAATLLDFTKYNAQSCNTTKATPCLSGDILGDWREEVILWDGNNSSDLLIFTTTTSTKLRVPCLMEDHNYRMAIAWQNTAYNQPPHLGYSLGSLYDVAPAIVVTSGPQEQTVELGSPMRTVVGTWKNMTGVKASGAKNGITVDIDTDAKTFTVSGTPTAVGTVTVYLLSLGATNTITQKITVKTVEPTPLECVAHFPMDEIETSTPNAANGTEAAAFGHPALTDGRFGNAALFNGTDDYFVHDDYDAIRFGDGSFTLEFWFRTADDAAYLVHKGSHTNNGDDRSGHWFGIEIKNGNLNFAIDDDVTKSGITAAAQAYLDNNWHHLVAVRDAAAKKILLYVDAVLIGEADDATGAVEDHHEALVIGNVGVNFNNPYAGSLDELRLWRGAMSDSRVYERYTDTGVQSVAADPVTGPVTVYTPSGRTVYRGTALPTDLPRGLYIVVTPGKATKIVL